MTQRSMSDADLTLDALLRDDSLIDSAVASAQRDAIRHRLLLGHSIVVWRDGKVVEVWPTDPEAAELLRGER